MEALGSYPSERGALKDMVRITDNQKFELGQLVATKSVSDLRERDPGFNEFAVRSLFRYAVGDWGDSPEDDKAENDLSVKLESEGKQASRIVAVYNAEGLPTIWIITEWDRSYTTVLFPDEY